MTRLLGAAVLALPLTACSDGGAEPSAAPVTETVTATVTATPHAGEPLELRSGGIEGAMCLTAEVPSDWAWWGTEIAFHTDVDWVELRLVDAQGVELVGAPAAVPPRNPGGRVLMSGMLPWGEHQRSLRGSSQVVWDAREPVEFMSGTAGQTAMLLLRLRLGQADASLEGLEVAWTGPDGETGTVSVPAAASFDLRERCPT